MDATVAVRASVVIAGELLDALEVGLGEGRELSDGVAQDGKRRSRLDGQGGVVNPLTGQRPDRPGADEHLTVAVSE